MKNKNIHILPTDKPSRLKQNNITKKISLVNKGIDLTDYTPINIYITSPNEDINENDYIITKDGRLVEVSYIMSKDIEGASKVILTTDQDLIDDGVQSIDDEFLEWFVKNPSCDEVKVEDYGNLFNFRYLINPPKEEPTSCACGANISCQCEEPKEKTFEEILSKMTLVNPKHLRMTSNGHGEFPDGYMLTEDGVKYIVKQLKNK